MVQRVSSARVLVESEIVAEMGHGLLALVGVARGDGVAQADELARKLVQMRIFPDATGRMNRSLLETGGTLGVVSQFTLLADTSKGRRPGFSEAADPEQARPLIERVIAGARDQGVAVVSGRFRSEMSVQLVNEGPVTLLVEVSRSG